VISQFVKELKRRTSAAMHEHLGIGGHFWENPHDRVLVETPDQLLFAVAYDHRNPVRVGLTARPQKYERSSARWWADGTASDVPLCVRPDLPFGISKEAFRTQLVTFQDSKAVTDIMEACARRDRVPGPQTPGSRFAPNLRRLALRTAEPTSAAV